MLFSYIVGHVPVNFHKKNIKNKKVIKKIQNFIYGFREGWNDLKDIKSY